MSQIIDIKVPDIGDYSDVPVIEILVKAGDVIAAETALVTLESDKATMDVPSPQAGTVKEVLVKLGERVAEGAAILRLEIAGTNDTTATPAAATASPAAATPASSAPPAAQHQGSADASVDLLVLGAGPGGYSAAFRAADLGLKVALVERYPTLGGVCLNVGCIPSKALLHIAAVLEEAQTLAHAGVSFAPPQIDLDALRAHKAKVVGKLTGGLSGMAKARKVDVIQGEGSFLDPHHLQVSAADGSKKTLHFARAIIAAGSTAVNLPTLPSDPRIINSTGALTLPCIPKRMLVIGGGIIGLEMATVYSALGARITVVELGAQLMPGADRDLVKVWEKKNALRFDRVLLGTGVTGALAQPEGILVSYDNGESESFDLVLVAVGRTPNGKKISAENAGVLVDERGFIPVDVQLRSNVPHIFAIGDIVGQPMLAHKAVHEAHVAAEVAAGEQQGDPHLARAGFDVLQIPSVAYTSPEIAWAGQSEEQLKTAGIAFDKAVFPWAASGRAIANGAEEGFTKLLFDSTSKRLLGGAIVGASAGDLISEVCLAIEMGCDASDIGKTIHPHPTLGESVGLAAEAANGSCTDLPPRRK